jgi:hypothetical protein
MFWIVTNSGYRIVSENVFNSFQDIVVTSNIVASMANIATRGVQMKEKPTMVSHDLKFYVSITNSLFINLCDSFDEDGPSPFNVVVLVFVDL